MSELTSPEVIGIGAVAVAGFTMFYKTSKAQSKAAEAVAKAIQNVALTNGELKKIVEANTKASEKSAECSEKTNDIFSKAIIELLKK